MIIHFSSNLLSYIWAIFFSGLERMTVNGVNDHLSDDSNTQDSNSSTRSLQQQRPLEPVQVQVQVQVQPQPLQQPLPPSQPLSQQQPQPPQVKPVSQEQPQIQQTELEPQLAIQTELSPGDLHMDSSQTEVHIRRRRRGRPRLLYPGPENAVKRQTRLKEVQYIYR